jgi:hypothetical protein
LRWLESTPDCRPRRAFISYSYAPPWTALLVTQCPGPACSRSSDYQMPPRNSRRC